MVEGNSGDHVELIHDLLMEIRKNLTDYDLAAVRFSSSKSGMLELRLKQNAELLDLLRQHRRALNFMAGNPVEPETHFGEAIVTGTFGGGV